MATTTFFIIDNGKVRCFITDSTREIDLAKTKYGEIFYTRTEAVRVAMQPKAKPIHYLTDEERKLLELEQIAYGRSQMTESERAEIVREKTTYERLVEEFEFARHMENWSDQEYKNKKIAFEKRYWYERKCSQTVTLCY